MVAPMLVTNSPASLAERGLVSMAPEGFDKSAGDVV